MRFPSKSIFGPSHPSRRNARAERYLACTSTCQPLLPGGFRRITFAYDSWPPRPSPARFSTSSQSFLQLISYHQLEKGERTKSPHAFHIHAFSLPQ